tara:strand:- start:1601 stop:1930 length:330 start_codon:yes stop_codon:yes gene_type:complete
MSEFITLITSIVFAGAIFYLIQRIRAAEKELIQIKQLSVQTLSIDDVTTIFEQKLKRRVEHVAAQEEKNIKGYRMEKTDTPRNDDDEFSFDRSPTTTVEEKTKIAENIE